MKRKKPTVLIVVAHPDDEVLGCGGTIAKLARSGCEVDVLIMAEGLTSRDLKRDRKRRKNELSDLVQAAQAANEIIGVTSLEICDFPDNRMDSLDLLDVTKRVEEALDKYRPERVFTHHVGDLNIDHRVIHQAVITACRPVPGQGVKELLFFEVPSSTEWQIPGSVAFSPNWFEDVSETINLKCRALESYHSEMRQWPHARSIAAVKHLAHWRGATAGVEAAEAFMLGRKTG